MGDEFGDFFGLLFVEDAGGHPARGGAAVDAVFDRVEDPAFGRFDRLLRGRPFRRAVRARAVRRGWARSCRRCRPSRACGRCRSWSGRGDWPPFRLAGDLLVAGFRVALGVEDQPGDHDREDDDQQTEDDEGALAHLCRRPGSTRPSGGADITGGSASRGTRGTSAAARTRRSAASGGRASRPWRIRFMCSS